MPKLTSTSSSLERTDANHHGLRTYYNRRAESETTHLPYRSFVSLRTFYAFGAKSRQSPGLPRSLSYTSHDTWRQRSYTNFPPISSMQHPVNGTSFYNSISNTKLPRNYPSSFSSFSESTNFRLQQSRATKLSSLQREMLKSVNLSDRGEKLRQRKEDLSATAATTSALSVGEIRRTQPVESPHNNSTKTIPKSENPKSAKQEDPEMQALVERNKYLENEVERLRLKLRDQERTEKELRKKLLECAAEVQVWKKKCEMQRTSPLEIDEPREDDEKLSDMIEQLSSAAEKLTRLNAVKDLKLLQSEMETALKEISQ